MRRHLIMFFVCAITVFACMSSASAVTRLRNICRLKGQEENTLNGLGLVVGLNGTGEAGDPATSRLIGRAMELLGSPIGTSGRLDSEALEELKNVKNVALVTVTATVPATGARRGENLDCVVSALNGKSLQGGQLAFTALKGPNVADPRVFALCTGPVQVHDPNTPTVGRVHSGCRMEQDVYTPFFLTDAQGNMAITLVLDRNHASFHTAAEIAQIIERDYGSSYFSNDKDGVGPRQMVRAIDATNIVVRVPEYYRQRPVEFAAEILEREIYEDDPEARVVIDTAKNTIVISGDVTIGDVVVAHNSILVEAGTPTDVVALDNSGGQNPSLERLVEQLRQLKVSDADMVKIIENIYRAGKLHGKLIMRR